MVEAVAEAASAAVSLGSETDEPPPPHAARSNTVAVNEKLTGMGFFMRREALQEDEVVDGKIEAFMAKAARGEVVGGS
mgnify:FL=1